jgi:PKHD-type hydroxylase
MGEIPKQNRLSTQTFTAWGDAFTPAEIDRIEAIGDAMAQDKAVLLAEAAGEAVREEIRITRTAWIKQNPDSDWLYRRLQQVVSALNAQSYQYALTDFSDNLQYTVYHGHEGGHYDWHVDHGPLMVQRKLSVSLQLSDGEAYDGCDLQFMAGNKIETAPRERGAIIAFPSYVLHRVTPVTRGVRKSLVAWVTGPNFR